MRKALGLSDPLVPSQLATDYVLPTVDILQGGWADRFDFDLGIGFLVHTVVRSAGSAPNGGTLAGFTPRLCGLVMAISVVRTGAVGATYTPKLFLECPAGVALTTGTVDLVEMDLPAPGFGSVGHSAYGRVAAAANGQRGLHGGGGFPFCYIPPGWNLADIFDHTGGPQVAGTDTVTWKLQMLTLPPGVKPL